MLFYVGLTVGEKEWPQGDDLGGYCDHPCVRWGACITWWQESWGEGNWIGGDGGLGPIHGWDVVCEGERGIKDELTSEMAPTSHPPNYFQAILKPFLYVLIVPCAVTATI